MARKSLGFHFSEYVFHLSSLWLDISSFYRFLRSLSYFKLYYMLKSKKFPANHSFKIILWPIRQYDPLPTFLVSDKELGSLHKITVKAGLEDRSQWLCPYQIWSDSTAGKVLGFYSRSRLLFYPCVPEASSHEAHCKSWVNFQRTFPDPQSGLLSSPLTTHAGTGE